MTQRPFDHLHIVADFLSWQHRFARIDGHLADIEGFALLTLAARGGGVGAIVEIGSFLGRSTAFLAAGSKSLARERVFAVDHFRGSPQQQPGQRYAHDLLTREGTTYRQFMENLTSVQLEDYVVPVVATSQEAAGRWKEPIRLLFIDGDHAYESALADFELWSPFVVRGGFVCFHDVSVWPGITQAYEQIVRRSEDFREVATIACIKVLERLKAETAAVTPA